MTLLLLILIPCVFSFGAYLVSVMWDHHRYEITLPEFAVQLLVSVGLMAAGYYIALDQATTDIEVWNSEVATKVRERVSCRHSYPCRCRTISCGKNCTTTHCDTCWEHSYDVEWYLATTSQERVYIDTINRQGTQEPPRWTKARISDPVATLHNFTNYIKANPWTLMKKEISDQYELPAYPTRLYDYHYIDRLISYNIDFITRDWNDSLQKLNSSLGVKDKVNIIIVLTKHPESYSHAVQSAWLGGKKNDVIVFIGISEDTNIAWSRVVSWTTAEKLKIELRDDILEIGTIREWPKIMKEIQQLVDEDYKLMDMNDYKYLLAGIEPSYNAMWFLIILQVVVSGALTTAFFLYDLEDL